MEIQKVKVTQTRKDAIFKNINKKELLQREERIQNDRETHSTGANPLVRRQAKMCGKLHNNDSMLQK